MNDISTQVFLDITSTVIAVALVVGVILLTIALFRIAHALKIRNKMLKQVSRPFIYCQRNKKQIMIKNIGSSPAIIDNIESKFDLQFLVGQTIPNNQAFYYNVDSEDPLDITIRYHDQLDHYHDEFHL